MKNLSVEEKRDLEHCVFQALGKKEAGSFKIFFQSLLFKIKKIFRLKQFFILKFCILVKLKNESQSFVKNAKIILKDKNLEELEKENQKLKQEIEVLENLLI